jgi:hypothetical protein
MSDKVYYKVTVTKEYVVEAETTDEALKDYKQFSVWSESDKNAYELFPDDLPKYGIVTNKINERIEQLKREIEELQAQD